MKRYIKASIDSRIPEEYLPYLQSIDEYMRANGAEISWGWNGINPFGTLIKFDGSSKNLKDGRPWVDGYVIWQDRMHVDSDAIRYYNLTEYAERYLNNFTANYNALVEIVNKLPETDRRADEIANNLTSQYSLQYPGVHIISELRLMPGGDTFYSRYDAPEYNFILTIDEKKFEETLDYSTLMSSDAEDRLRAKFDKELRRAFRPKAQNSISYMLKSHSIDTTPAKYELYAESYERYGSGRKYRKRFTCPGNYIAYLSMVMHEKPTFSAVEDYFGEGGLEDLLEENPTVNDIADYAAANWWGDGDDFIIYLKNLTTGETLYSAAEEEGEFIDEDEE